MKSINVLLATDPKQTQLIGTLFLQNRQIHFEYASEWINTGFTISPYSLPLKSGIVQDESNIW